MGFSLTLNRQLQTHTRKILKVCEVKLRLKNVLKAKDRKIPNLLLEYSRVEKILQQTPTMTDKITHPLLSPASQAITFTSWAVSPINGNRSFWTNPGGMSTPGGLFDSLQTPAGLDTHFSLGAINTPSFDFGQEKNNDNDKSLESDGGIDITDSTTKPSSPTQQSTSRPVQNQNERNVQNVQNVQNFQTNLNNYSKNTTFCNNFRNQPQAFIIQQKTTTVLCQPPSYQNVSGSKRKFENLP